MRVAALDIVRYGHLEGTRIDFGPARAGDITVIYGDNEAGKSTIFSAWLDLLFGIPRASAHAFRHERQQLEIAATLELPEPMTIRRAAAGLLDADGQRLDEGRLRSLMQGLDRDTYLQRYSIDQPGLRRGGEAIAKGEGDLGEALFIGSSGLSGAASALDALQETVRAFYLKGGRKQTVPQAKARLMALGEEIRDADLRPERWDRLRDAVDRASAEVSAAAEQRAKGRKALALAEASLEMRTLTEEERTLADQLAGLPDGPSLAPGAAEAVRAALASLSQAEEDRAVAQADRERAVTEHDAQLEPEDGADALLDALARVEAAEHDGVPLIDRARTAAADLPELRRRLVADRTARDAALARAGAQAVPDADDAEVEGLADAARACLAAEVAQTRAAEHHRREADAMPPPADPPEGRDAIEAALRALPDAAHQAELEAEAIAAREAADRATLGLPPDWTARLPDLPARADLEAALAELAEARAAHARAEDAERDAALELQGAEGALERLSRRPEAMPEETRRALRAARDRAWAKHRATLDRMTAEDFETAMQRDDAAGEAFLSGAELRARLAEQQEATERLRLVLEARKAARRVAETAATARREASEALLAPIGVGAPAALDRLDALRNAEAAMLQADQAHRRWRRVADARAVAAAELYHRLALDGAIPDDASLRRAADARLSAMTAEAEAALRHAEAARRLAEAERTARDAQADAKAALETWARATRLGSFADWTPARFLEALPALREALGRDAAMADRAASIARHETALAALDAAVAPLPQDGADAIARLDATRARGERIRARRARREQAQRAILDADRRLAALAVRTQHATREIDTALPGEGGPETAAARLALVEERDGLRARHAEIVRAVAALRARFEDGALDRAAAVSGTADAVAEAGAALAEAEATEGQARQALGRAQGARDEALAVEGGTAARQERAALLESLRGEARAAAAAMLGDALARAALSRHQERNRGEMLEVAQSAFARLSGGAWTRLETGPGAKGGDALLVRGPGGRVRIDALSTGAQGQLFLALRLAGYARAETPLPLMLDDVLETFDDDRARAALSALASLPGNGQAILLTHHRHLVALAREVVPDVRVVELDQGRA